MEATKVLFDLYPPIEPYNKGYLAVSPIHKIYYEECGNPGGTPLLYIHGGPGAGCDPKDRQFFDPKKWRIILFDQRGCGRSLPFAETKENTTQDLVTDMKKLLDMLGIKKVVLFGGSWGSTLATVFAIYYPEVVLGLVLQGIFLGNYQEIYDSYVSGKVAASLFPDIWERYISMVPEDRRDDPLGFYWEKMNSPLMSIQYIYAYELARYENSLMNLEWPSRQDMDKEMAEDKNYFVCARIEAYYFLNNCFMADDFIIKGAKRIAHLPIVIVQGRYDIVCPPENARRLHKALPESKFIFTLAGHSHSDPETKSKLIEETNLMYEIVNC